MSNSNLGGGVVVVMVTFPLNLVLFSRSCNGRPFSIHTLLFDSNNVLFPFLTFCFAYSSSEVLNLPHFVVTPAIELFHCYFITITFATVMNRKHLYFPVVLDPCERVVLLKRCSSYYPWLFLLHRVYQPPPF